MFWFVISWLLSYYFHIERYLWVGSAVAWRNQWIGSPAIVRKSNQIEKKKKKKKKRGKSKIQWETGTNAGGWVKNPDFLKDTQMTCASGEVIRRGHAGGTTSSIPQRIITWHWIKYDLFFVILQFYNWLKVLKPVTLTLSLETISNK